VPTSEPQKATDADLAELREAVLDDWLRVTSSVTDAVTEIENTLSWRVTRPLRLARILQRKVGEVGVIPASQLAATAVAKRLGR
jgi:phage gp36-like protein